MNWNSYCCVLQKEIEFTESTLAKKIHKQQELTHIHVVLEKSKIFRGFVRVFRHLLIKSREVINTFILFQIEATSRMYC